MNFPVRLSKYMQTNKQTYPRITYSINYIYKTNNFNFVNSASLSYTYFLQNLTLIKIFNDKINKLKKKIKNKK